jgi:serine/threonine-protein kinase PknG
VLGDACAATVGCRGTIDRQGYCSRCGKHEEVAPSAIASRASTGRATTLTQTVVLPPPASAPAAPSSQRRGGSRVARESGLGAGLVDVPTMPAEEPEVGLDPDPAVPETSRYCAECHQPAGRSRNGRPGRLTGHCTGCGHPYSFVPPLAAGDLVARQYEIKGCLGYGGLGWVYLARDSKVDGRPVVLKGHRDPRHSSAMVAERRFLSEIDHPKIVRIFNFVVHDGAEYIVEEYVGGKTLKDVLKERRRANGGRPAPLPVELAIAYILGILPAFSYLHGERRLLYNDFKPDNVKHQGEDVKLLDLGAVMRMGGPPADVWGTDGYQAPEVAGQEDPSVASDLYTVARCLAVLTMNIPGYQREHRFRLPEPSEQPLLGEHPSLHRLLVRGTARDPADRFQSADEMAEQLRGVLREVAARREELPEPWVSGLFGGDLLTHHRYAGGAAGAIEPDWRHLPAVRLNPADAAATFVVNVAAVRDPAQQVGLLEEAIVEGRVPATAEARLGLARALIETGRPEDAERWLEQAAAADPRDWRLQWYRGLALLAAGRPAGARGEFDRLYTHLPGELAPKLALALAAELSGDLQAAAALYDAVSATDAGFTSAAFGLARVRLAAGDADGAVAAYERVPETSSVYTRAQVGLVRVLIGRRDQGAAGLVAAATRLGGLELRAAEKLDLRIELLRGALALLESGAVPEDEGVELLDRPLTGHQVRLGLEEAYRALARGRAGEHKVLTVDMANEVRPWTPE